MERVASSAGPVTELVAAVRHRDPQRLVSALAPDVVLEIPPLHLKLTGREEVLGGIGRVLDAFTDLTYRTGSRYLAPGVVTDEALVSGTQTGTFLGSPPGPEVASLHMRVIARHDGTAVLSLTIYPDVASLRALGGGTARYIDLTVDHVDVASPMVSALRASMADPGERLIVGTSREKRAPTPLGAVRPAAPAAPPSGAKAAKAKPKAPVPRNVRRRRGLIAGTAMLVVAIVTVAWVTVSALRTSSGPASVPVRAQTTTIHSPAATPSPATEKTDAARTTPRAAAASGSASSLAPPPTFDAAKNEFTFASDLLFDTNSSTLTPKAQAELQVVIARVLTDHRFGVIQVAGYTDSTGGTAFNLRLSRNRAKAVATALTRKLRGYGVRVQSRGFGEAHAVADNRTKKGQGLNRRVTVTVPPPKP
jgi:outer membrane protein OmpA-like peptidoglycan-associated protein